MSMDLTAKDMQIIIDNALERYYDEIGGDIVESSDDLIESDGTHACFSADDLRRRGFNKNFEMSEFIERLKEDVDFTSAVKERLDFAF